MVVDQLKQELEEEESLRDQEIHSPAIVDKFAEWDEVDDDVENAALQSEIDEDEVQGGLDQLDVASFITEPYLPLDTYPYGATAFHHSAHVAETFPNSDHLAAVNPNYHHEAQVVAPAETTPHIDYTSHPFGGWINDLDATRTPYTPYMSPQVANEPITLASGMTSNAVPSIRITPSVRYSPAPRQSVQSTPWLRSTQVEQVFY